MQTLIRTDDVSLSARGGENPCRFSWSATISPAWATLRATVEHSGARAAGAACASLQWAVRATRDAKVVLAYLRPTLIDANDRLLVMARDGVDWAGINLATRLEKFEP